MFGDDPSSNDWRRRSQRSGNPFQGLSPDSILPVVGTAFLWDGAHMVAEAPLSLDGHVAWDEAVEWHFEGGESDDETASHRPLGKRLPAGTRLPDGRVLTEPTLFPIVCDHLGTPKEMFDPKGTLVWAADHYVWGAVRSVRTHGALALRTAPAQDASAFHCPWRFPGQYEDAETGLFYNRHRHYDPLTGQYASPDPVGLAGGDRPHNYAGVPTIWADPLGLAARLTGAQARQHQMLVDDIGYNVSPTNWDRFPAIGANGTYITDAQAITSVIGPMPKGQSIVITSSQARELERQLGLAKDSLENGFKIREVRGIGGMNPRSPLGGNDKFLGGGQHLPGGGPEIGIDSISTTGAPGVTTLGTLSVR